MPLFKLLPGLPSGTFSSTTAFFGGIFLVRLLWRTGINIAHQTGLRGAVNAELAAGIRTRYVKEEKMKGVQ
jgi:hypothetical protein